MTSRGKTGKSVILRADGWSYLHCLGAQFTEYAQLGAQIKDIAKF